MGVSPPHPPFLTACCSMAAAWSRLSKVECKCLAPLRQKKNLKLFLPYLYEYIFTFWVCFSPSMELPLSLHASQAICLCVHRDWRQWWNEGLGAEGPHLGLDRCDLSQASCTSSWTGNLYFCTHLPDSNFPNPCICCSTAFVLMNVLMFVSCPVSWNPLIWLRGSRVTECWYDSDCSMQHTLNTPSTTALVQIVPSIIAK